MLGNVNVSEIINMGELNKVNDEAHQVLGIVSAMFDSGGLPQEVNLEVSYPLIYKLTCFQSKHKFVVSFCHKQKETEPQQKIFNPL